MSVLRKTVVKALLTDYPTKQDLLDAFNAMCTNSILILETALANGDLISNSGVVTTDATHYIITIDKEWKDEDAYNAYQSNSEMLAERAQTDAIFEVTRSAG